MTKIHCKHDELLDPKKLKDHPKFPILVHECGLLISKKTMQPRKPNVRKDGYLQISMGRSSFLIHRIVAEAWISNPDNKTKINHKNGIKTDNRVQNLEWCTQRENIAHARDILGVKYNLKGNRAFNAKITTDKLEIVKRLFNLGLTKREIAFALSVDEHTIGKYVDGK